MKQVLLSEGKLLNAFGKLNETGYSTTLIKEYRRRDVKINKLFIKEKDYYYIANSRYALCFTVADNSLYGEIIVTFIDFEKNSYLKKVIRKSFSNGNIKMPNTSKDGDIVFVNKDISLKIFNDGVSRNIKCKVSHFDGVADLECDINLEETTSDTSVIVSPFPNKKQFYYSQKINCMKVRGIARIGGRRLVFSDKDSFGLLNWTRGLFPSKTSSRFAYMCGIYNGKTIGFNFQKGIKNSNATENCIYYNARQMKVDIVDFYEGYNEKSAADFMLPWDIRSNDKNVNLVFTPLINMKTKKYSLISGYSKTQIFGYYSGRIKFENKILDISNLVGCLEITKTRR